MIRQSYFPNLDIVPGNLDLMEFEHETPKALADRSGRRAAVLHPDRRLPRRVLALRDLGQTVRALVRDLDDLALVIAQGQENTARRDLSFIEKANFARQMIEAGYERRIACDALSIDKTLLSRMLSVTDRVPVALIEAIGAAPGIGRDRWLAFADLSLATPSTPITRPRHHRRLRDAPVARRRFEALEAWLAARELTAVNSRAGPATRAPGNPASPPTDVPLPS